MKATLEFEIEDKWDRSELECALKGEDLALILWRIVHVVPQEVSKIIENHDQSFTVDEALGLYTKRIHDEIEDKGIVLDRLVQ